ncbi:MAG: hypothetical protein WA215_08180 [Candidatus Cybelea sp.]
MNVRAVFRTVIVTGGLCIGSMSFLTASGSASGPPAQGTIHVKGTGIDLLNGAIIHSKKTTPTGEIRKSTEIVELRGDLDGTVLYGVTTVINTKQGTLTNSGDQVFSGTIAGSEPVMIRDSKFSFSVNLRTGAEHGSVYLTDHIAGPQVRCQLQVTGTGKSADGNPTFKYAGTCAFEG